MISKYIAVLLVLAGYASCQENQMPDNGKDSWVCKPEPKVTITLTFDSGQVYVNTFPKDIYMYMTTNINRVYLFRDGDQYCVRGDTLYYVNPIPDIHVDNCGFVGTMLSSSKMKLQSFGGIPFPDNGIYIMEYLFERKTN